MKKSKIPFKQENANPKKERPLYSEISGKERDDTIIPPGAGLSSSRSAHLPTRSHLPECPMSLALGLNDRGRGDPALDHHPM